MVTAHPSSFYTSQNKTIEGLIQRIEDLERALAIYKDKIDFDISNRFVIIEKFTSPSAMINFDSSITGLYQTNFDIENLKLDLSKAIIETKADIFYDNILLFSKNTRLNFFSQIKCWGVDTPNKNLDVVIDLRPNGVYGSAFDHKKLKSNFQGINDNILHLTLKNC